MKKVLLSLFVLICMLVSVRNVQAISFSEGIKDSKPMALLIYANWAEDISDVMAKFKVQEAKYSNTYNFVLLNIASEDTKEFNKKYHIYPNLPYVLLYKDNGKISRYLQKSCVLDDSCFTERLDFFTK